MSSEIECIFGLSFLSVTVIWFLLAAFWGPRHKLFISLLFGALISTLAFGLLWSGNQSVSSAMWVAILFGLFSFGASRFWMDRVPDFRRDAVQVISRGGQDWPAVVTDVSRDLMVKSGFLFMTLCGTLIAARVQGVEEELLPKVVELLQGFFTGAYAVCAFGFYRRKRWAFTPSKYLIRFDWLGTTRGRNLAQRMEESQVRDAFGLD